MTKRCTQCGETKPLAEFPRERRAKDGRKANCKMCQSLRNREQYLAHREERRARRLAYYRANRERLTADMRAYDKANREQKLVRLKAYRDAHQEEAAARTRAWRKANPERCRALKQKRRAWKLAVPYEDIDPRAVYLRDEGCCGICGMDVDPGDWHLDHIVPLAKGGHHVWDNVQVAHPACNMSKGARAAA